MEERHKTQPDVVRGGIGRRPPTRIGADEMPPARYICCACRKFVKESKQILPHMSAYVCRKCEEDGTYKPIAASDIANKLSAPWTRKQVKSMNDYQSADDYLPLVCADEHKLIARKDGLRCPNCPGFELPWAYTWMLDGSWKG